LDGWMDVGKGKKKRKGKKRLEFFFFLLAFFLLFCNKIENRRIKIKKDFGGGS